MAAGQDQAQSVVLLIWWRLDGEFSELSAIPLIPLEPVEGAPRSNRLERSTRVRRYAVTRPTFESCHQRSLVSILRQSKNAESLDESCRDPSGLLTEDLGQGRLSRHGCSSH